MKQARLCTNVATFDQERFALSYEVEHLRCVNSALQETARVMELGGELYFTLNSHYAYEWWPCGQKR